MGVKAKGHQYLEIQEVPRKKDPEGDNTTTISSGKYSILKSGYGAYRRVLAFNAASGPHLH